MVKLPCLELVPNDTDSLGPFGITSGHLEFTASEDLSPIVRHEGIDVDPAHQVEHCYPRISTPTEVLLSPVYVSEIIGDEIYGRRDPYTLWRFRLHATGGMNCQDFVFSAIVVQVDISSVERNPAPLRFLQE